MPKNIDKKGQLKRHWKKIIIVLVIIILIVVIRDTILMKYLTEDTFMENKEMFLSMVKDNMFLSMMYYVLTYIIIIGLSIPGATFLTLAGGFLFGSLKGAILVNLGATTGATISFLLSRYLVGEWVQKRYSKKLKKFNDEIDHNGWSYLLTLRFIPVFPFFLINLFAGLTKIRLRTFIWTTSLGIFPGSLLYALAGHQLRMIGTFSEIFSRRSIYIIILLICVSIMPVLIKKISRWIKKTRKDFGE